MKIKPQATEKQLFPEGNQRVILFSFFHAGQIKSRDEWLPSDKFVFTFEGIDAERLDFGNGKKERQIISRTVYGRKYFEFLEDLIDRPLTKAEKEEGFDVSSLIGRGYLIQVQHIEKDAGKKYANLRKIRSPLDDCGDPENDCLCFSITCDPANDDQPFQTIEQLKASDQWSKLAEWQQKEVEASEDYQKFSDFK